MYEFEKVDVCERGRTWSAWRKNAFSTGDLTNIFGMSVFGVDLRKRRGDSLTRCLDISGKWSLNELSPLTVTATIVSNVALLRIRCKWRNLTHLHGRWTFCFKGAAAHLSWQCLEGTLYGNRNVNYIYHVSVLCCRVFSENVNLTNVACIIISYNVVSPWCMLFTYDFLIGYMCSGILNDSKTLPHIERWWWRETDWERVLTSLWDQPKFNAKSTRFMSSKKTMQIILRYLHTNDLLCRVRIFFCQILTLSVIGVNSILG